MTKLVQNTDKTRETAASAGGTRAVNGDGVDVRINRLPAITWHRLKVNDTLVRLPEAGSARRAECRIEGAGSARRDSAFSGIETGAGRAFDKWMTETGAERVQLQADETAGKVVRMHIEAVSEAQAAAQQAFALPVEIEAGDGRELTVIMDLRDTAASDRSLTANSDKAADPSVLAVQTKIRAGRSARVKLVQLQLTGNRTKVISDIGADAGDNARIEIVQLFVGGADAFAGSEIDLRGDGSSCETFVGYLGTGSKKLDFNYNAVHRGKNTDSKMTVNGVLRDSSEKAFRGTIDFKTGASGAVGAETEDVLLLGENIVNKTVPLILCAEEDVKGSHGASIGQLDEEMLFYMASRGISGEKAVDLMAGARIERIIREIGDRDAETSVLDFLGMETEE